MRSLFYLLLFPGLLFPGCSTTGNESSGSYLFAYFAGNGPGQESIRFALSPDGYNYRALNNNEPVISSDSISTTGGVRDPHLIRGSKEDGYYMVATDLYVPEMGWQNYAMILMHSDDLINWTSTVINIPETYPQFNDVYRVWAPQVIYDEEVDKYMVYFSMLQPESFDKIYFAYANEDFTALESAPKQLFYNPEEFATIDGDIIKKDGKFHLFYKTEGAAQGIAKAISDSLTRGYEIVPGNMDQTEERVEGSGIFKLHDSEEYILMYDMYIARDYQFTKSTDLENFEIIDNDISMDFHPRHGSVLPIDAEEAQRLMDKWATPQTELIVGSDSDAVKTKNMVIDQEAATIYLPLVPGSDLSSFDPEFNLLPGAEVTPKGARDFSDGPIEYTISAPGVPDQTFDVTAAVDHNPVLQGYYADPEIIYSEKHGKFFLYPTSDGYHAWSGTYFKTFSSTDLINWTDEGVILDLKEDVEWTSRNAWAPTMIEKEMDGEYKYFYYFTAAQQIGVAVNDEPFGRFTDLGEPLISFKSEGVRGGQEIDPDIFTDPVSGKDYLYWGNGYLAVVELGEDMTSFDRNSLTLMTPDETFREGVEVFYRDGTYYFLWSENDTRSEDYRVRYATADSPLGPLNIPENNLILSKIPEEGIYGTGHNSVIRIPGKDEWYIVYHRFNRPDGITMGRSAGYHREVSIDKLEFNADGSIQPVTPSLRGIEPVVINE